FHGRDAQVAQRRQPWDNGREGAFAGEGADVQFVEDEVLAGHALPAVVGPGEPPGADDCRGAGDAVRLPQRAGVGALRAAVEAVGVALSLRHLPLGVAEVAAAFTLRGYQAPPVAYEDQLDAAGPGRPDPPPNGAVRPSDRP